MTLTIYDIIEIASPFIAVAGCFIIIKKKGLDTIRSVSLIIFISMSLLSSYAVYLSYHIKYNIMVYTIEHALMLFSFSYISFLLIKKRLSWYFSISGLVFALVFILQLKNFDAYHSFNGIVSGIFSYCLIVSGLIIFLFLAIGEKNIKEGYQQFAPWFAAALVVYCTSTFLYYIGIDYLTYKDVEMGVADTLWHFSTYAELAFFILLCFGFIKSSGQGNTQTVNA